MSLYFSFDNFVFNLKLKLGHDIVDYRLGETTQENDDNAGLDSELLEERKDMDFTDHLWKVWCCFFLFFFQNFYSILEIFSQ
jgi:hypothetical protein